MNFFNKLISLTVLLVHLRVYCAAASVQCDRNQFRCDNGDCVGMIKLCDGEEDCSDGSDEIGCLSENRPKCGKYFVQCASNGECFVHSFKCDEEKDCDDGSDEFNCAAPVCARGDEFECLNSRDCIPMLRRCDGTIDCDDASDELNCNPFSQYCTNREFSCEEEYQCVSRDWLCDGEPDCGDGSDEKRCEQSCPNNYCMQNADCVVVDGQYYCNCPPSFTGQKCEMRIKAERDFQDLGIVIGVSATLLILFAIIVLMLVYYCNKGKSGYSTELMSKTGTQTPSASYSKK